MRRNIIRGGLAGVATVAATLLVIPGAAFAWTYSLTGSGSCQPDGSYKITWTVDNTAENEALHITASSDTAVVPVGTDIAAHQTQAFYQTAAGTAAANFSLSLSGNFPSDHTIRNRDASVSLSAPCAQPQKDCDNDYDNSPASECSTGGKGGGPTGGTTTSTTPSAGSGQVLAATTTAPSQVAVVPTGSVNGGEGGAGKTSNPAALAGLAASLAGAGSGAAILWRRRSLTR